MNGMFNSTTLDVIVGLIFVYLLLAIMCSSINEWIAGLFKLRSATLTQGIRQLLDQQAGAQDAQAAAPAGQAGAQAAQAEEVQPDLNWLLRKFNAHPLITGMKLPGGRLPSYLPSRTFATALIDIVTKPEADRDRFASLEDGIAALPDGDVKNALEALVRNASGDLAAAQKNIEDWFDDTMDQVSGWYKRKAALITLGLAAALTLGTNADTIAIVRNLWTNPTVRAELVEDAKKQTGTTATNSQDILDKIGGVLPSWDWGKFSQQGPGEWSERVLGWILTIAAVSLGAPFWFDILGKLANLRNAGQKPDKSPGPGTDNKPTGGGGAAPAGGGGQPNAPLAQPPAAATT